MYLDLDSHSDRLELVRRFYDLLNRGEWEPVLELIDEEFVYVPLRAKSWSPPGVHFHGHQGFRTLMAAMNVPERGYSSDMELRTVGDRVLATGTVSREEARGIWETKGVAMIFVFKGNLISGVESFPGEREALASLRGDGEGRLTPRQREIFTLLAQGLNGPEIAEQLGISPATVRTHVGNAMEALSVKTRAQAVAEALRLGEISP